MKLVVDENRSEESSSNRLILDDEDRSVRVVHVAFVIRWISGLATQNVVCCDSFVFARDLRTYCRG